RRDRTQGDGTEADAATRRDFPSPRLARPVPTIIVTSDRPGRSHRTGGGGRFNTAGRFGTRRDRVSTKPGPALVRPGPCPATRSGGSHPEGRVRSSPVRA